MSRHDDRAEEMGRRVSPLTGLPLGLAECGCPNRIDGMPPLLHLCRQCGFEGGRDSVHPSCSGCVYLAGPAPSILAITNLEER